MEQKEKLFGKIVQDNHASIFRICRAYLYDKAHADDLYQEILLQLWTSLDKYRGDAQLSTWVYRVAVNTAITYNAGQKKYRVNSLPDTVNIPDDGTHVAKEKEQQLSLLTWAIGQLEGQDRLIILLVLEDLSYKEIAEITGSSVSNTGARISRIKTRIMKLVNDKKDSHEF